MTHPKRPRDANQLPGRFGALALKLMVDRVRGIAVQNGL